jgi:HlyD family secretion protein
MATDTMPAADTARRPDSPPAPAEPTPAPRRRRWVIVLLLLAAAVGATVWYFAAENHEEEDRLVLMGNIDVRQVNLAFKVPGRIESMAVDEGDPAKAGQVVATLDKRYFYDDLALARARRDNAAANLARLEHGSRPEEIAQARALTADRAATLERAKLDFRRAKNLVDSGAVSREEYDQLQAALTVAQAQLKSAQEAQRLAEIGPRQEDIDAARAVLAQQDAMLVQSQRNLADADLVAPNDGTILTRAREPGAIVQAGETVFTLTLTSPVWVRTYVNERDLGLIRPDMPATVITDTDPRKPYPAHVGFISPTAEFTPKTVETREIRTDLVYRLRVVVNNPDGGLRQGMPVTVTFDLTRPRQRTRWERFRDSLPFLGGRGSTPGR